METDPPRTPAGTFGNDSSPISRGGAGNRGGGRGRGVGGGRGAGLHSMGWGRPRGDLRVGDIAWDRAATAPTGAARSEPLARAQHRSVMPFRRRRR
eukprot:scaffold28381_cov74-Isochrysis_galbana.AAC.1